MAEFRAVELDGLGRLALCVRRIRAWPLGNALSHRPEKNEDPKRNRNGNRTDGPISPESFLELARTQQIQLQCSLVTRY